MKEQDVKRFIFFGAHPDDPDVFFGGTAVKLARAGHKVKFVSVTNGNAGHHKMKPDALAARRYGETQEVVRRSGIVEYDVMQNSDTLLENTLANRIAITKLIREFKADVVISHRLCDYHPDHRTTAQLVMDTSFLVRVPLFCPDVPTPDTTPVYAYSYDGFTDPRPIRPDAVVSIDDILDEKMRLLDCHESQFYEWLPWVDFDMPDFSAEGWSWEQRKAHLLKYWGGIWKRAAQLGGVPGMEYAEVFEQSEYGKRLTPEEFKDLFTV
ncbi:MAG: PIG-L family deacetylase [Lentisphaeria bacterium]|nr:PIG-L family deacetylase [Lentisphaeria bacterium]